MSRISLDGAEHYKKLLEFIEEMKYPRVIADFCADLVADIDHDAAQDVKNINNRFFEAADDLEESKL